MNAAMHAHTYGIGNNVAMLAVLTSLCQLHITSKSSCFKSKIGQSRRLKATNKILEKNILKWGYFPPRQLNPKFILVGNREIFIKRNGKSHERRHLKSAPIFSKLQNIQIFFFLSNSLMRVIEESRKKRVTLNAHTDARTCYVFFQVSWHSHNLDLTSRSLSSCLPGELRLSDQTKPPLCSEGRLHIYTFVSGYHSLIFCYGMFYWPKGDSPQWVLNTHTHQSHCFLCRYLFVPLIMKLTELQSVRCISSLVILVLYGVSCSNVFTWKSKKRKTTSRL